MHIDMATAIGGGAVVFFVGILLGFSWGHRPHD